MYIHHSSTRPKANERMTPIPRMLLAASAAAIFSVGITSPTHAQSATDAKAPQSSAAVSPAADEGTSRRERRAAANAKRKESELAKAHGADGNAAKVTPAAATDADKLICRTRKITGSNMAKQRCATAAEWAAEEERAQESLRKIQGQPITGVQEGVGAR